MTNPQQTQREMREATFSGWWYSKRGAYLDATRDEAKMIWQAAQQAMPVPTESEIESASDEYSKNDGGEGGCWLGDAHADGIRWLLDWQRKQNMGGV